MEIVDRIQTVIDASVNRKEEAGAVVVLTKDGESIVTLAGGFADIENQVPMTEDKICRAFSCSKIATSICAMILMERGQLDINWELERIIPEFANPYYIKNGERIACSRSIRIRDLLNMTSGIPYPGEGSEGIEETNQVWGALDQSIKDGVGMTTLEFAKKAAGCALSFDVGETWMYGASADIMGAVIEVISGKRLSQFMEENIFQPLGMKDTAFYVPEEKQDRLAVCYMQDEKGFQIYPGGNLCMYDINELPAFESGGAGLFTTAADYAKLGAMLANGGSYHGRRILGRKTIEFFTQNGITPQQKETFNWDSNLGYDYANFMRILSDQNIAGTLASKGSFGWDGWTGTYLLCDPIERVSITVFLQRCGAGTSQLARNVVNTAYSALWE